MKQEKKFAVLGNCYEELMAFAIDVNTGEVYAEFHGDDYLWFAEGKKNIKRYLKKQGLQIVKVRDGLWCLNIYVEEV